LEYLKFAAARDMVSAVALPVAAALDMVSARANTRFAPAVLPPVTFGQTQGLPQRCCRP